MGLQLLRDSYSRMDVSLGLRPVRRGELVRELVRRISVDGLDVERHVELVQRRVHALLCVSHSRRRLNCGAVLATTKAQSEAAYWSSTAHLISAVSFSSHALGGSSPPTEAFGQ